MIQKKYYVFAAIAVAIIAGILTLNPLRSDAAPVKQEAITPDSTTAVAEVKWYTVEEALKMQDSTKKKIFMDVYTTWCGPCKMLDANTFHHPEIMRLLNEYFIPVKFNAESGDTIVYKGQTYVNPNYSPKPRTSTHQFAIYIASTQQGLGYPTMVWLDENGDMIQPLSGYLEPSRLEPILNFFGTNAYKTTTWPDYYKEFKSAITQ
jgi:thioredoxin-related protein